jgi:arabinan endo-1,5-alpha-L-arabinosidase
MPGYTTRSLLHAGVAAVALFNFAGCRAPSQSADESAAAEPAAIPEGAVGKPAADRPTDTRDVPDPTIMKHGDTYYVYSTGPGIEIRRSRDLVDWELIGTVFPDSTPTWAQQEVPGTQIPWAPELAFFNGKYHLYFALSTFGSQRSVIGLLTNTTLDPADPAYEWVDQGKILESIPGQSTFNAIDGSVIVDTEGQPWLTWGSFWGGIKMWKLDAATGRLSQTDTALHSLATRKGNDPNTHSGKADYSQSIEGPYIIRRGDYYYLFVSWDACCLGAESTYNVRVGRSRSVTGPYLDRDGVDMLEGGGTLVLAGYDQIAGPGHSSILIDGGPQGPFYMAHHYVNMKEGPSDPNEPLAIPRSLHVRPLYWAFGSWPIAGEPINAELK